MKIHLDLDCFFVSAELTRHENLKHKAVVVVKGGDKKIFSHEKQKEHFLGFTGAFNSVFEFENAHSDKKINIKSIVIAKSYEAKAYGIKTGMPLFEALNLYPKLVAINSDHLFYQLISQNLKRYLHEKIPLLEQYSIDEFFGDLHGFIKDEDLFSYLKNLQKEILAKFDLPISIGASQSKWIAKLATDMAKPFGIKIIEQDKLNMLTDHILVQDFPGIGKNMQNNLHSYGVKTLCDLRQNPQLLHKYGKTGLDLIKKINGIDHEPVIEQTQRKGIGIGRNFEAITDRGEIQRRAMILVRYLSSSIMAMGLNPTTFSFKIKYIQGVKNSFSITQDRIFSEKLLATLSIKSLEKLDIYPHLAIRYIGISASNFISKENRKITSLIDFEEDEKNNKISKSLKQIRDKYGIDIVKYANN